MDITLDDVLTILDKHYNNVKALEELNQELISPWLSGRVKQRLLLWWAPQATKRNGGLPEGRPAGKDLLWLSKGHPGSRERRFHGADQGPKDSDNWQSSKIMGYQFFPCRNSRATSPPQRCQLFIWHIWRKRMLGVMEMTGAMIPVESKGLLKSLWCTWQGL